MANLNAYEQLLLKTIFQLKFKLKELLVTKDFQEVADYLNLDTRTIKKICTFPATSKELNLKDSTVDKLIRNLAIRPDVKTWRSFKARFSPAEEIINEEMEPVPDEAFETLSDEWKKRIHLAVQEVVKSIFSEYPDKELEWDLPLIEVDTPAILDKLELYLNTTWYFYFYHEENFTRPKLGRAILRIGASRKEVEIKNFNDSQSNDYSGAVSLDKNQMVLIFDMKTTKTREKWLHIKVSINTGDLPEIALGHYSNLGDGAISLVSGALVLEHIPTNDKKDLTARPFDIWDSEFSEIHPGIRMYLQDKNLNFSKTKAQIFTKENLVKFVKEYANTKEKKSRNIRLDSEVKVIITCPQTYLEPQEFEKYAAPCFELSKLLKDKLQFEVIHYPIQNYSAPLARRARSFNYFLDRILKCDILIIFYFDIVSSICLMELAWAAEHNKAVYLFTVDFNMIPRVFQYQKPSSVQIYPGHSSPQEALDYIKREINFIFKNAVTALQ